MRCDRLLVFALALVGAAAAARGDAPPGWQPADPAYAWRFPRDHHAHPAQRNEWWYLTGRLEAPGEGRASPRHLGYQLTFFRVGITPAPAARGSAWATGAAVMAHLAVTDLDAGGHVFSEVLWRAAPALGLGGFGGEGDPVLAWARAPAGSAGRWTLQLRGDGGFALAAADAAQGVALALAAAPARPLVLQGPNGYSRKAAAPGFASLYYSFTRMATEGTVTLGGRTYRVRGTSWLDREFGSAQLAPGQVGWDWFSLRLADGRDLMLYVLRRADGAADHRSATLVAADGAVRLLADAEWSVRPLATWTSPRSGVRYPSGWQVVIPGEGLSLTVRPVVPGAENVSSRAPGLRYWEGPVGLTGPGGVVAGEGYVELTGYGTGARPPI